MNDTFHSDDTSNVPWPTSGHPLPAADMSMFPGSEKAPPAVAGLLNQAVQGAHDTIDHLADSAALAARQLGERVSAAEAALHEKTGQLRDAGGEWVHGVRTTVRGNPLVSVAAAVALGAMISRFTR